MCSLYVAIRLLQHKQSVTQQQTAYPVSNEMNVPAGNVMWVSAKMLVLMTKEPSLTLDSCKHGHLSAQA